MFYPNQIFHSRMLLHVGVDSVTPWKAEAAYRLHIMILASFQVTRCVQKKRYCCIKVNQCVGSYARYRRLGHSSCKWVTFVPVMLIEDPGKGTLGDNSTVRQTFNLEMAVHRVHLNK